MECPRCKEKGLFSPMVRRIRRLNNQVYWWCKVCSHEEETNELGPQIWNSWGEGNHNDEEPIG